MSMAVLLIDDDVEVAKSLRAAAAAAGKHFRTLDYAQSADEAFAKLATKKYDIILLDLYLAKGGPTGLDILAKVKSLGAEADIVMLTSHRDQATALIARTAGALDYLVKEPGRMAEIAARIDGLAAMRIRTNDLGREARKVALALGFPFASAVMENVTRQALMAHDTSKIDVLIRGETGAGKETIAAMINRSRSHPGHPFVVINCANVRSELFESELFGHQKGAFTGAVASRIGKIQAANGGDLFLDEIDSLSLESQAKLLRLLENREIVRLGSNDIEKVNVRVIAATNADLDVLVNQGKMRADFVARLRGYEIVIPPLRDRPEDIEPIVLKILERFGPDLAIDPLALAALQDYHWPENVRELKKRVEAMATLAIASESRMVGFSHFSADFLESLVKSAATRNQVKAVQSTHNVRDLSVHAPRALVPGGVITISIPEAADFPLAKTLFESEFLKAKLTADIKSQRQLAKVLGITRSTTNRLLMAHGLSLAADGLDDPPAD